jgi:hypothetical protein
LPASLQSSKTRLRISHDARTKYHRGNFNAVLDGDIQGFLESTLRWRAGQPVQDDEEE